MSFPLDARIGRRHCFSMIKILHIFFLAALLFSVGCGKSSEAPIEVNESKVPKQTDESGNVEMTERTFSIKLSAPTPAWSVKISEIWVVGSEIWVLSELTETEGGMVTQVVTEISDSVKAEAPDIAAINYVIGKTGGWKPGGKDIVLVHSKDQIREGLSKGFKIWPEE